MNAIFVYGGNCALHTVRIDKRQSKLKGPLFLTANDLNIYKWLINKEQLILFLLVPFLHHVCHRCHAWTSTLSLKMTMSSFDERGIVKQCNDMGAEIVSSHARWSSFLEIWTMYLQLLLVLWSWGFGAYLTWINGCLGIYLAMVWQGHSGYAPSLSALRLSLR